MKFNSLKCFTFLALCSLIVPAFTVLCNPKQLHYTSIEKLVDDVINKKHPEASFEDYGKALLPLIKAAKFDHFREQLKKNLHSKNIKMIGLMFKQHQHLFSQQVRSKLLNKNEEELKTIFNDLVK